MWEYPVWPLHASAEALKLVKEVRATMPRVACPVLLISSAGDDFVRGSGPQEALETLGSQDKELVMLRDCGHVLTVGSGAAEAAAKTCDFIAARMTINESPNCTDGASLSIRVFVGIQTSS
jgi:esterase/lipase